MKSTARATLVALALSLLGCRTEQLGPGGCREDKDCGAPAEAHRCERQTGVCYCRTDAACAARELCNAAGFCQDRAGCERSEDCGDASLFCDTTTGSCLPVGRCSSDLHCLQGEVCDLSKGSCVPGCHTDGDCPGSSCRCGDEPCRCTATTPDKLAACAVGVCDSTFCSNDTFCRYGELCGVPPDAGVTRNQCYSDFDDNVRPYCGRCTYGAGIETCGTGPNFCIIDTRTNSTYCGADCSEGQLCPRGYSCRDIRVVYTRWQCSATQPCPADPSLPCSSDTDCRLGGTCLKQVGAPSGFCAGQCWLREGSAFGFCSCQQDFDCAQESCSAGECTITRRKCVTQDDCRTIRCVDFGGIGACRIGQNCTPTAGLTCVEVAQ